MEKIDVEICYGTTCFVLGGSQLQELENVLESRIAEKVNIIPQNCMGLCRDDKYNKAPFVKVNGHIVDSATVEKVIDKIMSEIR